MSAIPGISIASSTSKNWLDEAATSIIASQNPDGLMGMLQNAADDGKIGSNRSFLIKSQNSANAIANIAQSSVQAAGAFYAQLAAANGHKAAQERQARLAALLNPPAQTNFTPPLELAPVVYNSDGSSLDTISNILTLSSGKQIDITTGLPHVDANSIIQMANGAYLDTTSNILHESDGTQVDATTGIKITA